MQYKKYGFIILITELTIQNNISLTTKMFRNFRFYNKFLMENRWSQNCKPVHIMKKDIFLEI